MKSITKAMTFLLSLSLVLSLASCGSKGTTSSTSGTGKAAALKAVTLNFTLPGDVTPKAQADVLSAVETKLKADGLNFKIAFTYLTWSDYWNRVSMIAAAGEDQDILWTHSSQIGGLVASEVLAPLNSAIDTYGATLKANIPDYYWKGVTINNKIYGIPRTAPAAGGQQFLFLRQDLLTKYNMAVPKTFDDVAKYYASVKKNEPAMIPVDQDHSEWMLRDFGAIYFPLGSFSKWPLYVDVSQSKMDVKIWYESTFFKTVCDRNRAFYTSGYREKDRGTVTDAESWFAGSKLSSLWSSELKPTERVDKLNKKDPNIKFANVMINDSQSKYIYSAVDNILSVYAGSKKVNEAVALVNWIRTSQENFDLFTYGIKGKNYNISNEQLNFDGITADNMYSPPSFSWSDIRFSRYSDKLDPAYVAELKTWDKDAKISPLNGFIADLKPIEVEIAQVQAVEGEYVEDLTYGVTDYNKVFKDFDKKIKDAGIEKIRIEIQKQVDAFVAKNK